MAFIILVGGFLIISWVVKEINRQRNIKMFSNNKFNKNLFNNDSDSDNGEPSFGTNKDYAKNYNKFRSKELIKKRKYNLTKLIAT